MDVVITGNDPGKSSVTVPVTLTVGQTNASCKVSAGWNLISVPLNCNCMAVESLYPNAVSEAFKYDGIYNMVDTLENGVGYWLKFDADEVIDYIGQTITPKINLAEGWNIIGPFQQSVLVENLTTNPAGIIISNYFGYNGIYNTSDTLECGKGYWVKASEAGELIINAAAKPSISKSVIRANSDGKGFIETPITVSDGISNKEINLIAGIHPEATNGIDVELSESDLPPLSPLGLDARFVSNEAGKNTSSLIDYRKGFLGTEGSFTYTINYRLSNGSDGLVLTLIIPDGITANIQDLAGGKLINQNIGTGKVVFTNPLTAGLNGLKITLKYDGSISNEKLLVKEVLPQEYNLEQNFPNPFNPSTIINYALPYESVVKLEIFNTLGQRIAELANENQSAGYYEVKFDATSYSSGIYFCVMTAKSLKDAKEFKTAKKMLLMK